MTRTTHRKLKASASQRMTAWAAFKAERSRDPLKPRVSHHTAPFVVVSNPGTMFARIEDYCQTLKAAFQCKDCYDDPCDVLRQLPSGELTADFRGPA
jgi:hypothetical protein